MIAFAQNIPKGLWVEVLKCKYDRELSQRYSSLPNVSKVLRGKKRKIKQPTPKNLAFPL